MGCNRTLTGFGTGCGSNTSFGNTLVDMEASPY